MGRHICPALDSSLQSAVVPFDVRSLRGARDRLGECSLTRNARAEPCNMSHVRMAARSGRGGTPKGLGFSAAIGAGDLFS